MTDFQTALSSARNAMDQGEPLEAFSELRFFLAAPDLAAEPEHWREAWTLFSEIADRIVGPPVGDYARRIATEPDDPEALYALGYETIEVGLPDLAAGVLHRLNELEPDNERTVTEYVAALESLGRSDLAVEALEASPDLLETSFICRYLLAFHSIMDGEPEAAREIELAPEGAEDEFMAARISRFLARIDGLAEHGALDDDDLRGWQFVTTGSVLLHLSPYGFDEGMAGRYAFVQDSYAMCRDGLDRLRTVLEEWEVEPPRLFHVEERGSEILAHALGQMLEVPVEAFPEEGTDRQGVVVTYDLALLDPPVLQALHRKHPNQVLFTHAVCWTAPPPFAPDIHTLQYQSNTAPWGAQMRWNEETETTETSEPDDTPAEQLAARIVELEPDDSEFDPVERLVAFARTIAALPDEALPTALVDRATRPRFWETSPVKSSRFS